MSAFQREILVRFGHCDAAGWVFYPRYFEMISDFVEDWFEDGLAASAPGLFHHKQILTPSVHFTVDFVKPTRYGDRLTFNLWTVKIGKPPASFASRLRTRANCGCPSSKYSFLSRRALPARRPFRLSS
jgi:4-hydroxybenzoyl-CoA thioesterase